MSNNSKYPKLMSERVDTSVGVIFFVDVSPASEEYPVTASIAVQNFFMKKTAQGANRTWIRLSEKDIESLVVKLNKAKSLL